MPLDLLEIPGSPAGWAGAATQNLGGLAVLYDGKGALPSVGGSRQGSVATAKRQRLPIAACELAPARARRNFRVGIRYGGHPSFSMALSGRYNMQKISAAQALIPCGSRNGSAKHCPQSANLLRNLHHANVARHQSVLRRKHALWHLRGLWHCCPRRGVRESIRLQPPTLRFALKL